MTKKSNQTENTGKQEAAVEETVDKTQGTEETEETAASCEVSELELALIKQEEYKNTLQRLQAEFENYKKRTANESKRARLDGQDEIITSLLLLADSFDLAMSTLPEQASEGFKLVYKQLKTLFEKYSVTVIETKEDDDFNPEFHDAVLNEENPEKKGKILAVLMKGYKRDNRILRHSMVKVAI